MNRTLFLTGVLFLICFLPQAPLGAENVNTGQILRSQELLERNKELQEQIQLGKKVLIKEILVIGSGLTETQIQEITAPYKDRWLFKKDIEEVLSLVKSACVKNSPPEASIKISHKIKDNTLQITIDITL